jgi:hypothetical protein
VLKLVISDITVGICRTVCKIVFGTHRGALTIDLGAPKLKLLNFKQIHPIKKRIILTLHKTEINSNGYNLYNKICVRMQIHIQFFFGGGYSP